VSQDTTGPFSLPWASATLDGMKRKITFDRDGLTLAGNLFTPEALTRTASTRR
jgi:hypothetical protein